MVQKPPPGFPASRLDQELYEGLSLGVTVCTLSTLLR